MAQIFNIVSDFTKNDILSKSRNVHNSLVNTLNNKYCNMEDLNKNITSLKLLIKYIRRFCIDLSNNKYQNYANVIQKINTTHKNPHGNKIISIPSGHWLKNITSDSITVFNNFLDKKILVLANDFVRTPEICRKFYVYTKDFKSALNAYCKDIGVSFVFNRLVISELIVKFNEQNIITNKNEEIRKTKVRGGNMYYCFMQFKELLDEETLNAISGTSTGAATSNSSHLETYIAPKQISCSSNDEVTHTAPKQISCPPFDESTTSNTIQSSTHVIPQYISYIKNMPADDISLHAICQITIDNIINRKYIICDNMDPYPNIQKFLIFSNFVTYYCSLNSQSKISIGTLWVQQCSYYARHNITPNISLVVFDKMLKQLFSNNNQPITISNGNIYGIYVHPNPNNTCFNGQLAEFYINPIHHIGENTITGATSGIPNGHQNDYCLNFYYSHLRTPSLQQSNIDTFVSFITNYEEIHSILPNNNTPHNKRQPHDIRMFVGKHFISIPNVSILEVSHCPLAHCLVSDDDTYASCSDEDDDYDDCDNDLAISNYHTIFTNSTTVIVPSPTSNIVVTSGKAPMGRIHEATIVSASGKAPMGRIPEATIVSTSGKAPMGRIHEATIVSISGKATMGRIHEATIVSTNGKAPMGRIHEATIVSTSSKTPMGRTPEAHCMVTTNDKTPIDKILSASNIMSAAMNDVSSASGKSALLASLNNIVTANNNHQSPTYITQPSLIYPKNISSTYVPPRKKIKQPIPIDKTYVKLGSHKNNNYIGSYSLDVIYDVFSVDNIIYYRVKFENNKIFLCQFGDVDNDALLIIEKLKEQCGFKNKAIYHIDINNQRYLISILLYDNTTYDMFYNSSCESYIMNNKIHQDIKTFAVFYDIFSIKYNMRVIVDGNGNASAYGYGCTLCTDEHYDNQTMTRWFDNDHKEYHNIAMELVKKFGEYTLNDDDTALTHKFINKLHDIIIDPTKLINYINLVKRNVINVLNLEHQNLNINNPQNTKQQGGRPLICL